MNIENIKISAKNIEAATIKIAQDPRFSPEVKRSIIGRLSQRTDANGNYTYMADEGTWYEEIIRRAAA